MNNYIINFITLSILLITCTSSQAQKSQFSFSDKKYKNKYVDQLNEDEKIKKSWYNYVTTETKGKQHFVRTFYPETKQIVSYEQFSTKKYLNKIGPATYWYENGMLKSEGSYKNNKQSGQWKSYNQLDGSLSSTGMYNNGLQIGQWTYFENGVKEAIYSFSNGVKEGPFIEYDSLGSLQRQGTYKNNTLYSQIERTKKTDTIDEIVLPLFINKNCQTIEEDKDREKCAEEAMLRYIYKEIKYPKHAREHYIQGRVITQFVVNEEGEIEDLIFLQAICDEIKEECTRVILGMPKWKPGSRNGTIAKVKFSLPLVFRLDY